MYVLHFLLTSCAGRRKLRSSVHGYLVAPFARSAADSKNVGQWMGSILASPIRGELGYAHWPQLRNLINSPIEHQIWDPLGKEDGSPDFALTVTKFVLSNTANFREKGYHQSPGLD